MDPQGVMNSEQCCFLATVDRFFALSQPTIWQIEEWHEIPTAGLLKRTQCKEPCQHEVSPSFLDINIKNP